MSIKRMTAVWATSKHKGSRLLLLLALADNANDNGVCWPGYNYLSNKIRMSRRQTVRLVQLCNDNGELWTLNRAQHQSNMHVVTPGLTREELREAQRQVARMGAVGSMNYTPSPGSHPFRPPPAVLQVVTDPHYLGGDDKLSPLNARGDIAVSRGGDIAVSRGGDIAVSRGGDIAMSPDPSLTVIDPPPTVKDSWPDWKDKVLVELAMQMTQATFDTWLRRTRARREGGQVTIYVENSYALDWLEHRLRPVIQRVVDRVAREPVEMNFTVRGPA